MYIVLLLLLGFVLRLINIDKPEGLWNDEYISWFISSIPCKEGFFHEILKQCHLPLYYLYLKPFSHCSDLILRFTSILPSVISIYIMYLIGKEFSKKTGVISAGITSTLPFLIYYSQEVRFYSLLFLFSTFSLLFMTKIIKKNQGWIGYLVSSLLILSTHVLGSIYVFLSFLYLIYKTKKINKVLLFFIIFFMILITPLGLNIIKMLPSSQWWGNFSYTNILFMFSDYLSPILTNHVNAPTTFIYNQNLYFNLIMIIPTLIGILLLINGIKRAKGLALIALGTILATATLAICGKLVFITKYTIEILPIIILLISLGAQKNFEIILVSIFIGLNLLSVFTHYYSVKAMRSEGHKLVADILNNYQSDYIIFTYYEPNRFYRYLNTNAKVKHISKINRFDYLNNIEEIFDEVKNGEKVAVVFLDSVSFVPENLINQAKIAELPEMFITFSQIKHKLVKTLNNNFTEFEVQKNGSWTVISARKLK